MRRHYRPDLERCIVQYQVVEVLEWDDYGCVQRFPQVYYQAWDFVQDHHTGSSYVARDLAQCSSFHQGLCYAERCCPVQRPVLLETQMLEAWSELGIVGSDF